MKKIVITGAPSSGKTSVFEALKIEYVDSAVFVPEVATLLLSGGYPRPDVDLPWSPQWRDDFQITIARLQPQIEKAYEEVAKSKGYKLMFCDRGLLDGAAFFDGGIDDFSRVTGVNEQKALNRYDFVLVLESLAVSSPEEYGKFNNESRFESLDAATKLDASTKLVWSNHPHQKHIKSTKSIDEKAEAAIKLVSDYLDNL